MRYLCPIMDKIGLFTELGRQLRGFGDDERTQEVVKRACEANSWFRPQDVRRAVEAISEQMLRREGLAAWLGHYPVPVAEPKRVLVVMAGNIPLVGFFDLLCVLSAGHRCLVKPSTKDTVLVEYVVALLQEIETSVAVEFYDGGSSVDAVIATGGDTANRYFRARYADVPALLRGHRQSVAVLSGQETQEQLAQLADDIWAYSGLGCRNVSMIFAPEGAELKMKMIDVNPKYINNYRQTKALFAMSKTPFLDLGAAVAVEQREFPVALSLLSVARYKSLAEVEAWLTEHDAELQCVVSECMAHSRSVGFGRAQSPALTDYPDDRDVMSFLTMLNK